MSGITPCPGPHLPDSCPYQLLKAAEPARSTPELDGNRNSSPGMSKTETLYCFSASNYGRALVKSVLLQSKIGFQTQMTLHQGSKI